MKTLICWLLMVGSVLGGPEERLAEIRKWYGMITEGKAKGTKKISFEAGNEPLSGDVVIRSFGKGLKSITLSWGAGDHGASTEHYYYRNGELFFAFVEQGTWRFDGEDAAGNSVTRDTYIEQRLYLEKGACFRLLRKEVSGRDAEKLELELKKAKNEVVKPDDETAEILGRGKSLLEAKDGLEVLKIFAPELVPAE